MLADAASAVVSLRPERDRFSIADLRGKRVGVAVLDAGRAQDQGQDRG